MKHYYAKIALLMVILSGCFITACSNKDLYDEDGNGTTTKDASTLFNFSTYQTVALNMDYGCPGMTAGFKVYTKDPLLSDGSISTTIQPVYAGYTDSNCKFNANLTIPADISKLYVVSNYICVPRYLTLTIDNSKAEYKYTEPTAAAEEATSRNVSYTKESINIGKNYSEIENNLYAFYDKYTTKYNNYYSLLWYPSNSKVDGLYSKVYWNDQISSNSTFGELINRLNTNLDADREIGLDNSQYIRDTQHVNVTIANKTQSGETVDGAHLDLVYVASTGDNQNAMAYYYYPSNANATAAYIKALPKYVIFPRTTGYFVSYLPALPNVNITTRLQFFGADYKQSGTDVFPAGYTIGWMLVCDMGGSLKLGASIRDVNDNIAESIDDSKVIYSNKEANNYQNPGCITLYDKKSNKVIIGFEDLAFNAKDYWGRVGDNSYNDILFYVDADPVAAIYDPDQPTIPETPVTLPDKTYTAATGTLAFEDIWPKGGDYDMNDVVVEYTTDVTTNGNDIKKIVDTYKVVSKAGAAAKQDAFAFVINDNYGGTISSDSPEFTKEDNNQYILFTDARNCIGKTFTVTRTFNEGSYPQSVVYTRNYNPFIVPDYVAGAKDRIEVHLPKALATSWASTNNGGENAYYVNKDGKYPFAIDMAGVTGFEQVSESKMIGSTGEYPLFNDWVSSMGANNKDWYLFKKGQ